MLGHEVATWLRENVQPLKYYYHEILLSDLARLGILYDATAHMLILPEDGAMVEVRVYTPAELVKHPLTQPKGLTQPIEGQVVIGYEIAESLHWLLWPMELPPGKPERGFDASFERNLRSIAERKDKPYRDDPPGGWWTPPEPTRRKR